MSLDTRCPTEKFGEALLEAGAPVTYVTPSNYAEDGCVHLEDENVHISITVFEDYEDECVVVDEMVARVVKFIEEEEVFVFYNDRSVDDIKGFLSDIKKAMR